MKPKAEFKKSAEANYELIKKIIRTTYPGEQGLNTILDFNRTHFTDSLLELSLHVPPSAGTLAERLDKDLQERRNCYLMWRKFVDENPLEDAFKLEPHFSEKHFY